MQTPWHRSSNHKFLYTFRGSDDEYQLLVTNLQSVFEERLDAWQIERRGEQLNCPFALDTARQRQAFRNVLTGLLASETAQFNVDVDSTVIVTADDDVAFHWRFELCLLQPASSIDVLAALATELFGVIDNMGAHIGQMHEQAADKNAVIRGLSNANSRKVDYAAPKALDATYKTALGTSTQVHQPTDVVELAEKYWPAEATPVVENRQAEETDSDATHESVQMSDTENVWAGSLRSTYDE